MKKILSTFVMTLFSFCSLFGQTKASPSTLNNQVSNQIEWFQDYSTALNKAKESSKPVLILFTGTAWCPACIKLEREVLRNNYFIQSIAPEFVFLKAEFPDSSLNGMNRSPYKQLLDNYQVDTFPTMVIVDSTGKKLFSVDYQNGGVSAYVQKLLRSSVR